MCMYVFQAELTIDQAQQNVQINSVYAGLYTGAPLPLLSLPISDAASEIEKRSRGMLQNK